MAKPDFSFSSDSKYHEDEDFNILEENTDFLDKKNFEKKDKDFLQ